MALQSRLGGPWGNLRWDRATGDRAGLFNSPEATGASKGNPEARDPIFGRNSELGGPACAPKIPKTCDFSCTQISHHTVNLHGVQGVRVRNMSDLWKKTKDPTTHVFSALGMVDPASGHSLSVWRGSSGRFSEARPTSRPSLWILGAPRPSKVQKPSPLDSFDSHRGILLGHMWHFNLDGKTI